MSGSRVSYRDPSALCTTFFVLVALLSMTSLIFSGIGLRNADLIKRHAHKFFESSTAAPPPQHVSTSYCLDESLCDAINSTTTNDSTIGLTFDGTTGFWKRRDLCRIESDSRFFGTTVQDMFLAADETLQLESDTYLRVLTVSNNATIFTNGYRLFVSNKLVLNGTIDNSGLHGITYTDHSLGTQTLPGLFYDPLTFPTSTNAPGEPYKFKGGSYTVQQVGVDDSFNPCPLPEFTEVFYTDLLYGGANHLSNDPSAAIIMRDLRGILYTGGSHGCRLYNIQGAPAHLLFPFSQRGGQAGGIVVISAHKIEFGPDARIDASGGASQIGANEFVHNATEVLGMECIVPLSNMYQFPGGSGGGGVISIITATAIDQATIDRVCRVGRAPNLWVPPLRLYCNSSGFVSEIEELDYRSFNDGDGDGSVFVHDVCNTWPGDRDLDGDNVYECSNDSANNGTRCDCVDTDPLIGDTWTDQNHCGACNQVCTQDCVYGRCVPQVASFFVDAVVANINTSATILNDGPDISVNVRLVITVLASNTSVAVLVTFDSANALPNVINQTAWLSNTLTHNCTTSVPFITSVRNASSSTFVLSLAQHNESYACLASTNIRIHNTTSVQLPWLFTSSTPILVPIHIHPLNTIGAGGGVYVNGNYQNVDIVATGTMHIYGWFAYVSNYLASLIV